MPLRSHRVALLALVLAGGAACSPSVPVSSSFPDYTYTQKGKDAGPPHRADGGSADAGPPPDAGPPVVPVCTPAVTGAYCRLGAALGVCCGSDCTSPTDDAFNCGGCGIVCSCGVCVDGGCATSCPQLCGDGGACRCGVGELPLFNPANGPQWPPLVGPQACVALDCPAGANGASCAFGVASTAQAGAVGRTAESLRVGTCCNGACVDLGQDPQNCGGCGLSCGGGVCLRLPSPVGDPSCLQIVEPGCSGGTTLPDGGQGCPALPCGPGLLCSYGNCIHPPSDCAQTGCAPGLFCDDGKCAPASADPYACWTAQGGPGVFCNDTGGACNDLASDPLNCGGCCQACAAGEACVAGACQGPSSACGPGRSGALCALDAGDLSACCSGACVNLLADVADCGGCGVACLQGDACCEGVCANLRTDTGNCGACGVVCDGGSCGQQGCEP